MKMQSALATALFAALAMLALGAQAADADKAPPAAGMKAEPGATVVKPHSHLQEKTGVPQSAAKAAPGKKNAAQDKTKHYHPRDMK